MSGEKIADIFESTLLSNAAKLGAQASSSGSLTAFELECDNTITAYLSRSHLVSFGAEAVLAYLVELDNEITNIRMILTGKLSGIAPETIRERLRLNYV
jgi:V/A-type H+-transporting ATPase subunit C